MDKKLIYTNSDSTAIIEWCSDIVKRAFNYVYKNNKSNNAPYHNLNHLLRVCYYCYNGSLFHEIGEEESESLLIAALFHDFNHSQGKEDDSYNIKQAISGFKTWKRDSSLNSSISESRICDLIRATQYPYIIDSKDLFLEQKIIRDSDLMQVLDHDWIRSIIYGLGDELNMDISQMLESQISFHEKLVMNSVWGKQMYDEFWPEAIAKIKRLRNLQI